MNPLVSIIMPTYKGTDNIIIALERALNQSYNPTEIIIVDDNGENTESQLQTERLLDNYIKQKKITYITHKKNKNGSAARNTGMKYATGKYISFLDDDDLLDYYKIEKQVELFETLDESYGLVYCSGYVLKENGIGYALSIIEENTLYNLLSGKLRFNSSMIMIRYDVFMKIEGFDESYERHQDWEFCCRVLEKYKPKAMSEHLVYKYVLDRNNPRDPDRAAEMRMYFLNKNMETINRFSKKEIKEIISFHYRDIAIIYGLAHKPIGTIRWLCKAGNLFVQAIRMFTYIYKRKHVKRIKYNDSLDIMRK